MKTNLLLKLMMELSVAETEVENLMSNFRDVGRFIGYCRECRNYGRSWACPPFESDPEDELRSWKTATIIVARIEMPPGDNAVGNALELLQPGRSELERLLLDLEKNYGGLAFGFSGGCSHCHTCTRPEGRACRHPELVRPALEAYGFDVCRIMEDILGDSLQWASGGKLPHTLTLVGALFHNHPAGSLKIEIA